jgi:hypothetical protein
MHGARAQVKRLLETCPVFRNYLPHRTAPSDSTIEETTGWKLANPTLTRRLVARGFDGKSDGYPGWNARPKLSNR